MTAEHDRPSQRTAERRAGWIHVGIAAAILAISAVSWTATKNAMKWVFHKQAVPWAADVRVNEEEFRLTSLPEAFGPYMLAADGELDGDKDGQPDGEIKITGDVLAALKIGTSLDKSRVSERESNWYVSRIYIDTRKKPGEPYRAWRLDVTYYTGGLDKVPHVPERCLAAAGAKGIKSKQVTIHAPGAPKPWDGEINLQQTQYSVQSPGTFVTTARADYYIFSLNGMPEDSWEMVRLKLNYPWLRHCYFAKIQFTPLNGISDSAEAQREVEDFAAYFLPSVLRMLPMPPDVERLGGPQSTERRQS